MKLLYCYVEKFKEINRQQFNFSSKYKFNLNSITNEFYINTNSNYISSFFSEFNDIDITAIVGKNGVGKSTVLSLIKHMFLTGFIIDVSNSAERDNVFAIELDKQINIYMPFSIFEKTTIYIENNRVNQNSREYRLNIGIVVNFILYDVITNKGITKKLSENNKVIGPILSTNSSLIYYTNQYDFNWNNANLMEGVDYFDLSLTNRIYDEPVLRNKFFNYESHIQNPDNRFLISSSQKFLNKDIANKIKFLSYQGNRDYLKDLFHIPPSIYITLDYMSSKESNFLLDIDKEKLLRYERNKKENFMIENIMYELLTENSDIQITTKNVFLKRIIDSYFRDIENFLFFKKGIEKFKNYERNNAKALETVINLEDHLIRFQKLFESFVKENEQVGDAKMEDFKDRFEGITGSYFNFIQFLVQEFFLQNELDYSEVFINKNIENVEGGITLSNVQEGIITIETSISNIALIDRFINEYNKLDTASEFFVLDWGALSLGEENLFTFLSEIELAVLKVKSENIIIMIDEGDLTWHPEWQRRFFDILLKLLNRKVKDKRIQIIITTHSPLLMSDLPIENIMVLEKNQKSIGIELSNTELKSSFAANIHELYKKGQFLESTTGAFAIKKIEKVLDFLNSSIEMEVDTFQKSYDRALRVIRIIGDPIIQNQLLSMLEERQNEYINRKFNKDKLDNQVALKYLKQMQERIDKEINQLELNNDTN